MWPLIIKGEDDCPSAGPRRECVYKGGKAQAGGLGTRERRYNQPTPARPPRSTPVQVSVRVRHESVGGLAATPGAVADRPDGRRWHWQNGNR